MRAAAVYRRSLAHPKRRRAILVNVTMGRVIGRSQVLTRVLTCDTLNDFIMRFLHGNQCPSLSRASSWPEYHDTFDTKVHDTCSGR